MPSAEFEPLLALARIDPDFVGSLLKGLPGVKVPDYHHARTYVADVRFLVPRTYESGGELLRESYALGEALGEARAILTVLDKRGVAVPDDVRDRVLECTDTSQLGTWLERAITVTSVDDVVRE